MSCVRLTIDESIEGAVLDRYISFFLVSPSASESIRDQSRRHGIDTNHFPSYQGETLSASGRTRPELGPSLYGLESKSSSSFVRVVKPRRRISPQ